MARTFFLSSKGLKEEEENTFCLFASTEEKGILCEIFLHLSFKDILSVKKTCKLFHEALSDNYFYCQLYFVIRESIKNKTPPSFKTSEFINKTSVEWLNPPKPLNSPRIINHEFYDLNDSGYLLPNLELKPFDERWKRIGEIVLQYQDIFEFMVTTTWVATQKRCFTAVKRLYILLEEVADTLVEFPKSSSSFYSLAQLIWKLCDVSYPKSTTYSAGKMSAYNQNSGFNVEDETCLLRLTSKKALRFFQLKQFELAEKEIDFENQKTNYYWSDVAVVKGLLLNQEKKYHESCILFLKSLQTANQITPKKSQEVKRLAKVAYQKSKTEDYYLCFNCLQLIPLKKNMILLTPPCITDRFVEMEHKDVHSYFDTH